MEDDIFCFLCGSEMNFNSDKEEAECMGCLTKYECYVTDGKVMGLGVSKEKT